MKENNHTDYHHYLHFANFIRLKFWSAVMVDETDTTG